MSIQSEIDRISGNVQASLSAVAAAGITVPEGANSDDLPALIEAVVNEKQDKADAVTVPGGAALSMDASLGTAPFTISFDVEGDDTVQAAQVSYDNTSSGMTAQNVQDAITECFQSASEGKSLIAAAVTGKGGQAAADDTFSELAAAITALPTGGGVADMANGVTVTGGTYQLENHDKYVLFSAQNKGAFLEVLYLVDEQYAAVNDSVRGIGSLTLQDASNGLTITDGGTNGFMIRDGTVQFTGDSITVYRIPS